MACDARQSSQERRARGGCAERRKLRALELQLKAFLVVEVIGSGEPMTWKLLGVSGQGRWLLVDDTHSIPVRILVLLPLPWRGANF